MKASLLLCGLVVLLVVDLCESHGRLVNPPGRSTAWRYNFDTPVNYNDHELFCGGYSRQWMTNKGNCGPCGDSYELPRPRANENGGKYGVGVIVKEYQTGQEIEFGVQLTANHKGHFEFHLCPHNNLAKPIPEDDSCFQKYPLQRADGLGPKYTVESGINDFKVKYSLPDQLTCSQCVIQWRYIAGNNWGRCADGTGKVGCGSQEEFRSCADVRIADDVGYADDTPSLAPTIPAFPDDESDEDNEIDDHWEDQDVSKLYPKTHSYSGHIGAVLSAVFLVLFLLLLLLLSYLWERGYFKKLFAIHKPGWSSRFSPPTLGVSPKNTAILPTTNVPVAPPRRNRKNSLNGNTKEQIVISNPLNVSVNGVPVTPDTPRNT